MDVVEPTTQPIARDDAPVTTTVAVPTLDDLFA